MGLQGGWAVMWVSVRLVILLWEVEKKKQQQQKNEPKRKEKTGKVRAVAFLLNVWSNLFISRKLRLCPNCSLTWPWIIHRQTPKKGCDVFPSKAICGEVVLCTGRYFFEIANIFVPLACHLLSIWALPFTNSSQTTKCVFSFLFFFLNDRVVDVKKKKKKNEFLCQFDFSLLVLLRF